MKFWCLFLYTNSLLVGEKVHMYLKGLAGYQRDAAAGTLKLNFKRVILLG